MENVAPQTRLLEMRRNKFEVDAALETASRVHHERESQFQEKEDALRKKDLELQATMIKMNALLQENEAKRQRAEKRAQDESRAASQKSREIGEGMSQLHELRREVADLEAQKAKMEKYHSYLTHYQQLNTQEFPDIGVILERFDTLRNAQKDLLNEQGRLLSEVEDERRALARAQKARSTQVLSSENIIGKMRERVEAARAAALRLQQGAEEATATRSGKTLELGLALQSIGNLYQRCTLGPYGSVIKHNPGDAEVLGDGVSSFGSGLLDSDYNGASDNADGGNDRSGRMDATMNSSYCSGDGGLDSTVSSTTSRRGGNSNSNNNSGSQQQPQQQDGKQNEADEEDVTGLDPIAIRTKMRAALAQVIVAGSYIKDYQQMILEQPSWIAEQRRVAEEKAAVLAKEAAEREAQQRAAAGGARNTPKKAMGSTATGTLSSPARTGGAGGGGSMLGSQAGVSRSNVPYSPMGNSNALVGNSMVGGGGGLGASMLGSSIMMSQGRMGGGGGNGMGYSRIGGGVGGRVAAAMAKQGVKAYLVADTIKLPANIAAPMPTIGTGGGRGLGGSGLGMGSTSLMAGSNNVGRGSGDASLNTTSSSRR